MRVIWTRPALKDLAGIEQYYLVRNPVAAQRLVDDIISATLLLEDFPLAGRENDLKNCRLLQVVGRPYLLPYRISQSTVQILAVFDERRKRPEEWQ